MEEKRARGRPKVVRSRDAMSRDSMIPTLRPMEKTPESMNLIARSFGHKYNTKTFIHPDNIPTGWVTLWARDSTRFIQESANIENLKRMHWKVSPKSFMPNVGGDSSEYSDFSDPAIRIGEMLVMVREDWIHEEEVNEHKRKSDVNNGVARGFKGTEGLPGTPSMFAFKEGGNSPQLYNPGNASSNTLSDARGI